MPVRKSKGTTPSEEYLAGLGERTFLGLWSYPNVYRDQRITAANPLGKELCDLLVVCGDDIVIFSDKSCAFPDSGDLERDWHRWFRRAIQKSAQQAYGAERWIREHPDRIFLDPECRQPIPVKLGDTHKMTIHRVVVALGAKERCRAEMNGGSGSLMVCTDTVGASDPLTVGYAVAEKAFAHVFDDVTLDIILRELDTITDFLSYLRRKEDFIAAGKQLLAAGEEELLAIYLQGADASRGHDFRAAGYRGLCVEEGFWDDFVKSQHYIRKHNADRISYCWDDIISGFTRHALEGTLVGDGTNVTEAESALRIMAREPRLQRRVLSTALLGLERRMPPNGIYMRTVLSEDNTGAYVFVSVPRERDPGNDHAFRRKFLENYCFVVASRFPELVQIVGLATQPEADSDRSHDLALIRPQAWTPALREEARSIEKVMKLHGQRLSHVRVVEYPAN